MSNQAQKITAVLILALLAIIFGWNYSQATIINKSNSGDTLKIGLVGWWTFDGAETTTTTITDKSGNGNTGTRIGITKPTTGRLGQAINLNGSTGAVTIGAGTGLGITGPISIAAWAKFSTNTTDLSPIYSRSGNYGSHLAVAQATHKVQFYFYDSVATQYIATSPKAMNDGQWHYYVGVYDGARVKLYVDNVVVNGTASTAAIYYEINYSSIGKLADEGGRWFAGSLDDVRVYNRALSPAEAAQLYKIGGGKINKSNSGNSLKNGLVAWWTFDGQDMTTVSSTDKSGNGNDATRRFGVKTATGKIGQALKLDGVDDAAYNPNTSSISFVAASSFSLSAWVKTATGTAQRLIARYEGTPYYNISIGGDCTANKACLAIRGSGGGEPIAKSTSNVNDNKWHLITGVRDVSVDKIYLYFDGILQATTADSSVGDFGTLYGITLGCHASVNCSALFLNGLLDDARVYNRALSAPEVAELFKQGGGKINKTDLIRAQLRSGLVGHWTFDGADMTAVTTTDRSGSGDNGTRTGTKVTIGKIGQALKFNGASDIVSTTLSGFPAATADVTVSFWAKPQNSSSDLTHILIAQTDVSTNRFSITLPYVNVIYWDYGNIDTTGRLNVTMQAGWYNTMAFWTFTSQTGVGQKIYRNGVVVASDTDVSTFTKGSESLNIGARVVSGDPWKGILDDVRIYSRALSSVEIMELYRMGK